MRTVKRDLLALITLTLLGALSLAGCAPAPAPQASETNGPTEAPVFASDEEALAAATEAYAAYLAMSDQILAEGGADPERIRAFTTERLADIEMEGFANVRSSGFRSVGESQFSELALQDQGKPGKAGRGMLSAYVCSDVSGVDVVDANGESVVKDVRPDFTPFVISFDLISKDPIKLLVAGADVWDGPGVCK